MVVLTAALPKKKRCMQLDSSHAFSTQRERDGESGLVHFRARSYNTGAGRFTGKDPIIGNRAAEHYKYASANPVSRADSLGLWDFELTPNGAIVAIAVEGHDNSLEKLYELLGRTTALEKFSARQKLRTQGKKDDEQWGPGAELDITSISPKLEDILKDLEEDAQFNEWVLLSVASDFTGPQSPQNARFGSSRFRLDGARGGEKVGENVADRRRCDKKSLIGRAAIGRVVWRSHDDGHAARVNRTIGNRPWRCRIQSVKRCPGF
jgi:RHS repeat-associated protein